jgi:hypothetical protein
LDSAECNAHEADEEGLGAILEGPDETRAVPEDKGDSEEGAGLRDGEETVRPECCAVRVAERFFEGEAVGICAGLLTGESGNGADGAGSFASNVGSVSVSFLVRLILEDDNALSNNKADVSVSS